MLRCPFVSPLTTYQEVSNPRFGEHSDGCFSVSHFQIELRVANMKSKSWTEQGLKLPQRHDRPSEQQRGQILTPHESLDGREFGSVPEHMKAE